MPSRDTPAFAIEATHVSGRRLVAHLVDGVVLTVLLVVLLIPAALVANVLIIAVLVLWLTVGHVAYFVLTQRRDGQSPGKRFSHVRVVDAHGGTPSPANLTLRSIPLLVEYFYVIAFIGMMSSSHRQRLGDRWAHTYVVDIHAPLSPSTTQPR